MMKRSFSLLAAIAAVSVVAPAAFADLTPAEAAELADLRARISRIEAQGTAQQARASDVAAADATVRADSAKVFTGWDKNFKIGSSDGNYSLSPIAQIQFRNVTNFTEGDEGEDDSTVNGFELRRARLGFRGNAFTKDFTYEIRLSVDRSTGEAILDNAFGRYQFADDWAVKFGQFKLNWTREETASSSRFLAVERSLLNAILGGGNTNFVQGVSLIYAPKDAPFRGEVQYTDGDNTANTNYQDLTTMGYQNFGIAARGEYLAMGDWKAYDDYSAMKTSEQTLVLGGGVDWAQGGDGDVYRMTVDAQFETPEVSGLGLYGAVIYTIADGDTGEASLDDSLGALVQAGYLLPGMEGYEAFARYSIIRLDEEVDGEDNFHEATVGLNKYLVGHNAKVTVDLNWLPNGTPGSASGLGYSNSTAEQIVLRTQFQLAL